MLILFGFVCIALGFSCGFLAEHIVQAKKIMFLKELHRASHQELFLFGWQHGYKTALDSPLAVKYRYEEFFGDHK